MQRGRGLDATRLRRPQLTTHRRRSHHRSLTWPPTSCRRSMCPVPQWSCHCPRHLARRIRHGCLWPNQCRRLRHSNLPHTRCFDFELLVLPMHNHHSRQRTCALVRIPLELSRSSSSGGRWAIVHGSIAFACGGEDLVALARPVIFEPRF